MPPVNRTWETEHDWVMGGKKKYINIFSSFTEPFNYNCFFQWESIVSICHILHRSFHMTCKAWHSDAACSTTALMSLNPGALFFFSFCTATCTSSSYISGIASSSNGYEDLKMLAQDRSRWRQWRWNLPLIGRVLQQQHTDCSAACLTTSGPN